jgi:hypothetical protein
MNPRKVNQISLLLLVLGLGSALVLSLIAAPATDDPQLNDPLASKKYLRELKVIGGQANVLADEFQTWFAGLWHGVGLARTVAVLTVGLTLGFRFVALHPGPAPVAEEKIPPTGPA